MPFSSRLDQVKQQQTRALATLLKKVAATDRTRFGAVLRKTFEHPVPPRIVGVDVRVGRLATRIARAPLHSMFSVISSIGSDIDRMFVDATIDLGHVGILTYRESGRLHMHRIEFIGDGVGLCPVAAVADLPEGAPLVDWEAMAQGQWNVDPGGDRHWLEWEHRCISYPVLPGLVMAKVAQAETVFDILRPALVTIAVAGALSNGQMHQRQSLPS